MGQPLSNDIVNCEFKVISEFAYENKNEPLNKNNRKVYYKTNKGKANLLPL